MMTLHINKSISRFYAVNTRMLYYTKLHSIDTKKDEQENVKFYGSCVLIVKGHDFFQVKQE